MRAKKTKVTDVEEDINQATPDAVVTAQPPMAQVSARFSVPVSQLAGGTLVQSESEDEDEDYSDFEEEPEPDPRTDYIQQRLNEERVKAYIYRVPDSVIRSNNIPDRLPKNAARLGYVACGNFAFNPETWEDDLRERVYDGAYFVIVKEAGKFGGIEEFIIVENTPKSAELKLSAAPGAPAPQYNPYQNIQIPDQGKATKDAITMLTQVANLQRELTGGYTPPKPVKEKSLLEQMTELKALNELMSPPQAQQQTDPMLRMFEVAAASNKPDLLSLVVDRMLGNDDDAPSGGSSWQDVLIAFAPFVNEVGPQLGNLLQVLVPAPNPVPAPPSAPTRQLAQPQAIPPSKTPASQPPPQPSIPVGAEQELIAVGDRMIQALANNTDAEEIAELYAKLEEKHPVMVTPIIDALVNNDPAQLLQQWATAPGLEKLGDYPHAVEWVQKLQGFLTDDEEPTELEEGNEMQKLLDDLIAAYERNDSVSKVASEIAHYAQDHLFTKVFIKGLLTQSNEQLLKTISSKKPELLEYEHRDAWLANLRSHLMQTGVFE